MSDHGNTIEGMTPKEYKQAKITTQEMIKAERSGSSLQEMILGGDVNPNTCSTHEERKKIAENNTAGRNLAREGGSMIIGGLGAIAAYAGVPVVGEVLSGADETQDLAKGVNQTRKLVDHCTPAQEKYIEREVAKARVGLETAKVQGGKVQTQQPEAQNTPESKCVEFMGAKVGCF
jgi:hypothetical protein